MAYVGITKLAFWVILPVLLLSSVIFRYNLLSCIYLLFALALPYTPSLSQKTIGSWAAFTLTLIVVSGFFLLCHIGFQIALLIHSPYGSLLGDFCSSSESIARYIGFVRLDNIDIGNVFRLVFPEIAIFLVSILTYVLIGKVYGFLKPNLNRESTSLAFNSKRLSRFMLINDAILLVTMLFLALAGIAYPSIISSIYLLVFFAFAIVWACLKTLLSRLATGIRFTLSLITLLHLLSLYLYQLGFVQHYIPPANLYARLFGLTAIIRTECHSVSQLLLQPNVPWTQFVSPGCIVCLHYLLAIGVQRLYQDPEVNPKRSLAEDPVIKTSRVTRKSGEKRPLVDEEEIPQNYNAVENRIHRKVENDDQLIDVEAPPSIQVTFDESVSVLGDDDPGDPMDNAGTVGVPQPSAASTSVGPKDGLLFQISLWFTDIKRYSFYVIALVVMMYTHPNQSRRSFALSSFFELWSVTYHSWLTFILLLASCFLWLNKHRGRYTLYCSPIFTTYGIMLILLQFIYSLNLTEEELPTKVNLTSGEVLYLSAFGIYRFTYPGLQLGAQLLFFCGFVIVFHQFNYRRREMQPHQVESRPKHSWTEKAASWIYELLSKYWIFVVIGFHLAVSSEGRPTGIKIIYMFLFLSNMIVYSTSWSIWRRSLNLYWGVVVGYSMIVLGLIYTYQFQSFPLYWKQFTNFTDDQLADLGLKQSPNPGELFVQIILPTLFLLAVILQWQYFNAQFLEFTQRPQAQLAGIPNPPDQNNLDVDLTSTVELKELSAGTSFTKAKSRRKSVWLSMYQRWYPKIVKFGKEVLSFIQRLLEFHIWRFVFIAVFTAAVYKVSALHAAFVFVWVLLLPFRRTHTALFRISSMIASVIVLGIMFYQLRFIVADVNLTYDCNFNFYGKILNLTYGLPNWLGVDKMPPDGQFFYHVQGFLGIILMVALEQTVMLRQQWRRLWKNEPEPRVTALYPSITNKQVDDGFVECVKFFLNYFFFKFGLEMCYVMAVLVVWARSDVFSVLYCFLLIITLRFNSRAALCRFWDVYVALVMIIILWQYSASLGMPPNWCQTHDYPWLIIGDNETIRNRLVRWLYLPDYFIAPYAYPSLADFFLLLFVVSQLFVFNKENIISTYVGNNKYLTGAELDQTTIETNPKKNFTYKAARTVLDQVKQFVFKYFIWITMAIIFFAGTSRISIFTLGYLIIFFFLLSRHQALMMGKPSHILKVFSGLIAYTVAVITLKAGFQLASCVYIETLQQNACFVVQLMSLACAKPSLYSIHSSESFKCEIPYANSGFLWDFVCFLILLIQRRIFASYYFLFVAQDLRVSMSLAARGAELFNERLIEEVRKREKIQEQDLLAIKESMQNIKRSYQSLRQSLDAQTTHYQATLSGDYYMFADDFPRRRHTTFEGPHSSSDDIMDPVTMLYKADTVGIKQTLQERKEDRKKLGDDTALPEMESTASDEFFSIRTEAKRESFGTEKGKRKTSFAYLAEDDDVTLSPQQTAIQVSNIDSDSITSDENATIGSKIKNGLNFLWELFLSAIDSFILFLNKSNRNYRNIGLRLAVEKERLIEATVHRQSSPKAEQKNNTTIEIDEETSQSVQDPKTKELPDFEELKPIDFDKDQHRVFRFFYAVWYVITSRTDIVCYFLIILNLMLTASMLSLVLPLAVFLWATIIIPRPAKFFWTFAIIYLEIVIVIKFIFQFEFFPWNSSATTNLYANDPFWWPRYLGIEQYPSWSVMDLLQLLAFVFHSSILKEHGIWDNVEVPVFDSGSENKEPDPDVPSTSRAIDENNRENQSEQNLVEEEREEAEIEEEESDFAIKKTRQFTAVLKLPYKLYRIYYKVLNQRFSSVTDVYLYMFVCDVINFLIIIFGYNAFGQFSASSSTNVVSNLQSNNVPTAFLVMLLIQFVIMFIDRAIYLMKSIFAKFIFQVIMVIAIHIWLFFALPYVNQRPFYQNHVAQTYYFFKAVYFLFAAYQIRAGYPKRVAGNFLTKSYGTVNLFLFKAYRAIPFLAEITAIMDWMYTGTSMSVGEWMKLWSIYAEVFEIKCWRMFEDAYPVPRGEAKAKYLKYLVGGLLLFILVAIIWFPLLLMNIALTIGGISNNPTQVDLKITVGSFEPIFQVIADLDDIKQWTPQQYTTFSQQRSSNENAASFLQGFSASEIVDVRLEGESKTVWIISPPQRSLLVRNLNISDKISVVLDWTLTNNPATTSVVTSTGSNQIFLQRNDTSRLELLHLLTKESNVSKVVYIHKLFPHFIHSRGSSSTSTPAYSLYPSKSDPQKDYSDVGLSIQSLPNQTTTSWWSIRNRTSQDEKPELHMVVFSDKVSPSSLNFLVNYGIIGLYVSVVLVVGRLVRTIFIGTTASIMFVELPYVDRILGLCNDIFLVREEAEYVLEEDLYAKLLFLYRSPSTLIQWTRRPKEE